MTADPTRPDGPTVPAPVVLAPVVLALGDRVPDIHPDAWIAPGAVIVGDVRIGPRSSVWYGCVLRADTAPITIGADSNVQDGTVVHADPGFPTVVGDRVSVGHAAILHGCTVADDVLVGMGARLLNGSDVGTECLVAAGALVLEGAEIPARSLVAGVPGKVRRELTEAEVEKVHENARSYYDRRDLHRASLGG